jgi:uncharacterized protein (TIGR03083 family)
MSDMSWLGPVIDVRPLFAKQQSAYLELLRGLNDQDWQRLTICPGWTAKDIAAHVLGGYVGRLSVWRDDFQALRPTDGEAFSAFINRINDEWVTAARRISPQLLTDLSSSVGDQIVEFWQNVDLNAVGWPVSWAGPDPAPAWLDAAREFTEYWTHQQQICEATGRIGLTGPEYLGPVLDTFMRALPHTLKDVTAKQGTTLQVTVTGAGGGSWSCSRAHGRWELRHHPDPDPEARVELDADTTWRLCTRAITREQAAKHAYIEGDQRLTNAALNIVSIIR